MAEASGAASPQPQPEERENDSDNDVEGPEPVEYSPGGRYGRQDLVLGRGAFKTVYKAFDEEEGTEVAWNQVRVVELVNSKEERDRLFAEIRVLKQLKHKNIMSFHDSWLDQKTMCVNFITELFTSGTLRQYRKRHRQIDEEVLKRWAWQILCGLVYLHGHTPPIIHRDLKCDNIFINGSQGVVKIGDLGLATLLRARTAPQSVLGTPEFMAPELYEEEYDDRVDVYSYGMCLLELATMEYPYAECRNAAQIYRKVTLGVRPAGLGKVASRELADFISVCIGVKEERPRSRQLLKHPYFDSIRERATARAEALSATASQIDMFSDYASMSTSGSGSDGSRSSSVVGDAEAHPVAGAPEQQPQADGGGDAGDRTPPPSPGPQAGVPPPPEGAGSPAPQAPSPRGAARSSPMAAAAAASGRVPSGNLNLTGSLQSAVESLHTIAESLPGLLAEGSPGAARAALLRESAEQDDMADSHPDREFRVRGKLQPDMEKLNLRLRISEPEGPAKTVEFDFDLGADTAMSVASEMVEDLSLSAEDARAIAAAIRNEIKLLTGLLHRRGDDSLASSSAGDVRAGSNSPPEAEQQQSADAELQHPFDDNDADLSPPAAPSEQPPPGRDRIQPSKHPFEPGGATRRPGGGSDDGLGPGGGGAARSSVDAQRGRGRVSFEESSYRQRQQRSSFSAGSSPPSPYLQQHHGQPLGSVPALRDPGGGTALSADAAALLAVASGRLGTGASPQPGGTPPRGASPAPSGDETMGVSGAANGVGSDGGSAMSLDALDSHAFDGHTADSGQHRLAGHSLPHSGSAKTLKGLDSAELGAQLGLVGVKRSGSGVLSPPPRAPERKAPLTKLFADAGHITGVPQRRNGLQHSDSLPAAFSEDTTMSSSTQRSGNSLDSNSVRTTPVLGGSRPPAAARAGLPPPGPHSSAAAASTQTHGGGNGGQQHPDLGGISGGVERPNQSTATSLPAAVAGSLASFAQRLSGQ